MCKMGTNNIEKRKREQEMMKLKRTGLGLLLLAGLLCLQTGCSASGTGQNEEKQSDENTQDRNETGNNENPEEPDPVIEEYERDTTPGSRTAVTLEEATKKKNNGEQFILLFTKDDCSYCAAFDEVLNPYLENHHLDILEVDLTEAEEMYQDSDRESMLNICVGGVNKTPALYYVESPTAVYLLDHSQENYGEDGLDTWVQVRKLDEAQK